MAAMVADQAERDKSGSGQKAGKNGGLSEVVGGVNEPPRSRHWPGEAILGQKPIRPGEQNSAEPGERPPGSHSQPDHDGNHGGINGYWARERRMMLVHPGEQRGQAGQRQKGGDWIGDIGANVCKSGSCHRSGNALDVTALRMTDGTYIDMNQAWKDWRPTREKRLYLAVHAALRIENMNVLTYKYPGHADHIHVDWGGNTNHVILRKNQTDTLLIQSACKWLNWESITVDGSWGSKTTASYNRLLSKLDMDCENPLGNKWSSMRLMRFIAMHGVANRTAGWWRGTC